MAVAMTIDQLGETLRARRKAEGLSLRQVEEATGVSAATLSRIERGSRPDFEIVEKLASWLHVAIVTSETQDAIPKSTEDLKRVIEVHLRAEKKMSAELARSIADGFDLVMRVEMARAAAPKRR